MHLVVSMEPREVRGSLMIYSCPKSICSHVNWALTEILNTSIELDWQSQHISPNNFTAELNWIGPIGTSARIVSGLSKWSKLKLECIQEPTSNQLGERFALTPELGIFRAEMNSLGETVVTESRLRSALERARLENESFEVELAFLLGSPWDEDLEPYRRNQTGTSIRWITKTG
jgi:hypothetical protein